MARQDLLSISFEDLVTFTNRGTANRAQREADDATLTCELQEEADGTVKAKWSDTIETVLPGGKTAREGRCTCPSVGMCRHLMRTILRYQQSARAAEPQKATALEPWCPGEISDEQLAQVIPKALLDKARQQFDQGILADVVRAPKPTAFLHGLSVNIRFQVPGDPRYTHVDCSPQLAPQMTALAVWAFRALPKEKMAGLVSSGSSGFTVPAAALDQIESSVDALLEHGFSAAPEHFGSALTRVEAGCLSEELVWPAEAVAGLAEQFQRYCAHDALFQPEVAAELTGELLIRSDAIRSQTKAVPQPLIRGTRDDRPVDLASSRYIGLGCGVVSLRKSCAIHAYMQDQDSGMVVAVSREFAHPTDAAVAPLSYSRLALTAVVQRASLTALGQGTLLLSGGKRTPSRRLSTARARSTVNPQNFQWDTLREPVRVEDFQELRSRLAELPPSVLRPRRVVDNFHALKIAAVENACFVPMEQMVRAVLKDSDGHEIILSHSYSDRGREGLEALLHALTKEPETVRFVAGPVKLGARGIEIFPTAVVCEANGGRRVIQPWVDSWQGTQAALADEAMERDSEPLSHMLAEINGLLSELMVLGLRRSDAIVTRRAKQLGEHATASGFTRLGHRVTRLSTELDRKQHSTRWDSSTAREAMKELLVLTRLGHELT